MQSDTLILLETLSFAAHKHRNQLRKDNKTPYINHPIQVAEIIAKEGHVTDVQVIQTALLHDTVEDTDTTFEEIEALFGEEIKNFVKEVTDDKSKSPKERKRLQIVNAPNKSAKAKVVKMAGNCTSINAHSLEDKIHNLRDLQTRPPIGWTLERVKEYYKWARQVTEGLRGINEHLERVLDDLFENGKFTYEGISYPCLEKEK